MINKIKSNFFLQSLFNDYLIEKTNLEIVRHNKEIQKRLNLSINNYKDYFKIIIELIPLSNEKLKKEKNIFIHIKDNVNYHIYFNNNEKEINRNYLLKNENIRKIRIKIDEKIDSLENLFCDCDCLEKINFIKFNRNNINNLSKLFYNCTEIKEVNLSKMKTENVISMESIFYECSSLKNLDISNFNTRNVNNMKSMFFGCSSINELNISNFDTSNVTNMYCMFYNCSSLKQLDLSNFNTSNVNSMYCMFYGCNSLNLLDISHFNLNKVVDMLWMFSGCSIDLKNKLIEKNNYLREESFWDYN